MREHTVTYNGERMSGYEATQRQRAMERKIRESKRKFIAYDEGIKQSTGAQKGEFQMRYAFEGKRLSKLNAQLDDFCSQTGLQKQYDRARVLGFGRSEAQKAAAAGRKSAKTIDNSAKSGIINLKEVKPVQSGAFYGALNPESDKDFERCQQHAERFYAAVRKRKTDIDVIAENTGFDTDKVGKIKKHIFLNKYDLGEEEPSTFYPNYDIAVSWQNLISGKDIEPKDIVLLEHEYYEYILMNEKGMSYTEAHMIAQEKYNYQKAVMDWRKQE